MDVVDGSKEIDVVDEYRHPSWQSLAGVLVAAGEERVAMPATEESRW